MSDHIGESNGMTDHIVERTKMVCVHCGLPFVREQNNIQSYRCGSNFSEKLYPQWARSMTCVELQNGQLQERIKRLEEATQERDKEWFQVIESILGFHPVSMTEALRIGIERVKKQKQRIKRLEEAGDKMLNAWLMPEDSMTYSDWVCLSSDAKSGWYKAKEAKL